MKRLNLSWASWLALVSLAGCEPSLPPPPPPPAAVQSAPIQAPPSMSYRRGMTWRVRQQSGEYVMVGSDGQTNAYQGDTTTNVALPVLCLKQDGRAAPQGIPFDFDHGWAGGEVKLTPPIPGSVLTSLALGHQMCAEQFGAGYRMAEFHDGNGGWNWWAQGSLSTESRFWVAINDQNANPWNSSGEVPPPPTPPRFYENENAVAGRFIVVLPESTADAASLAQTLATDYGGSVEAVYDSTLKGFTFLGSDAQARALSNDARVESVDQDALALAAQAAGTQFSAPWGLDRLDQRPRTYDGVYHYANEGQGVNVYVLDTGMRMSHQEFGGRAYQAVDFIRFFGQRDDCNGHGTAVASVIGGQQSGVAKGVNLISVRIAGCRGTAYNPAVSLLNSTIVEGMNWVARNHVKPAVVNLSYGSPPGFWRRWFGWRSPQDEAVARVIARGVTVVVAAGNEDQDADRSSPARLPEALTVGASTASDARASFSNWGGLVDLFAPGVNIRSAGLNSDTEYVALNGTSLAAPFVTGAVALYLKDHPQATPSQVAQALLDNATPNLISDPKGASNRLLYTVFPGPTSDVGILPGSSGCASAPAVTIHMDNEDNNQGSWVSGWVGPTNVDGSGNTNFTFCRVNGTQFHSLSTANDPRANYALLKLGDFCPAGSVEFVRHFDNEDTRNTNSSSGNIAPNIVDSNSTLFFCLFKGDGPRASALPSLGFDYGVFAAPQFVFASQKGTIHTDDEDFRNGNGYSADPAWKSAATAIISEGSNTDLRTARAAFPSCGDSICNGLETDWSCPADCNVCGNGTCGPSESASTCPYDCGVCGDGLCGAGETAYNCATDCAYCGDGTCSPGERDWCSADCGGCSPTKIECDTQAM